MQHVTSMSCIFVSLRAHFEPPSACSAGPFEKRVNLDCVAGPKQSSCLQCALTHCKMYHEGDYHEPTNELNNKNPKVARGRLSSADE
ncbi:hypothetical protein Ae201684P_010367 [Aphanomyces euteiches]|nr:hypothetical protein Ae201684P_010367 [Aphanomyces euteiches]